jgi:hypothetical protein
MQGLSKSLGRMAAVVAVSSLLVSQGAFATPRQEDRSGLFDRLLRVKRVVVNILAELGFPPG